MFNFSRKKSEYGDVYFRDSLLQMGYSGRLTVRVVTNSWVIVHVVGTVVLLLTDIPWVFWFGILNSLYLSDRFLHYFRPEEYLPSQESSYGNLALYLSPRARRAVISAYNRATILGGGFFLNLARTLSDTKPVLEMLTRLEINSKEFNSKLDAYLDKDSVSYRNKDRLLGEIEHVIFTAFENREEGQRSIDYADLFAALGDIDNEQLVSLFGVFEIGGLSLKGVVPFGRLAGYLKFFYGKRFFRNDSNSLLHKIINLEREYKVFVVYNAVGTAARSAEKYFYEEPLWNTVEGLIREAAIYVSRKGGDTVRGDDIVAITEKLINEN